MSDILKVRSTLYRKNNTSVIWFFLENKLNLFFKINIKESFIFLKCLFWMPVLEIYGFMYWNWKFILK